MSDGYVEPEYVEGDESYCAAEVDEAAGRTSYPCCGYPGWCFSEGYDLNYGDDAGN